MIFYSLSNRKAWIHADKIKVDNYNIPVDSNQLYFPKKTFKDFLKPWSDSICNKLYSDVLFRMKEPILYKEREKKETYRFTWLRSFNNSIIVRVEKIDDNYKLSWKVLCDSCGIEKNKLIVDKTRIISRTEWRNFKLHLQKTFFWRMWSIKPLVGTGMDGSNWILEGSERNSYHVVDRWTPDDTNFRKCCLYLIRLTDLKDIGKNKYSEQELIQ